MSRDVVTISHLEGRRLLAGSFAMLGAGVLIVIADTKSDHAESITLVDDGAGVLGYRIRIASGDIGYDVTEPTSAPIAGIKLDNATGHSVSVMRVVDTANSLGVPGLKEFDVVVRTLAGAVVQTSGIEVSWSLLLKDRG